MLARTTLDFFPLKGERPPTQKVQCVMPIEFFGILTLQGEPLFTRSWSTNPHASGFPASLYAETSRLWDADGGGDVASMIP
jgi:hypothetical protein